MSSTRAPASPSFRVQLADKHHRRALDARQRFGRWNVAALTETGRRLQLGPDEQQVRADAAQAIFERNAMNLADQLLLAPRHEFRHHAAEENQARRAFDDREHPRGTRRHDVAVPHRRRGDGTEIERRQKTAKASVDGSAAGQQRERREPVEQPVHHAEPGDDRYP